MLCFVFCFFGLCFTSAYGLPRGPNEKTYSRDGVLKRLLKQANEVQNVQTAIESHKANAQMKKPINPTRLIDKAKVFGLRQKQKVHTKNENELAKIMYGGKAKVSRDLFSNKKYKAVEAHTSPLSDLEFVTQQRREE